MKTLKETLEEAILALEAAQSGLQWYQDMHPEEVNGSDDEANLQIETAIKDLQAVVAQQDAQQDAQPVAQGWVWDCSLHPKGGWKVNAHFDVPIKVGTRLNAAPTPPIQEKNDD